MGLSSSWLAVRGRAADTILEMLGLEVDPGPHRKPPKIAISQLPNGWLTVLYPQDLDAAFKADLAGLSADGEAVACALEEHVMYSEARGYAHGVEIWRVVHNSEEGEGRLHLHVTGAPPAGFDAVKEKTFAEQAAEDSQEDEVGVDLIFDLPAEAAKLACGYKVDDDDDFDDAPIQPVRRIARTGLLGRLFGPR